jgi:hypothetical protein
MSLTNAYRCPKHNATIPNAAPKSKHIEGNAADVLDIDGKFKEWLQPRLEHFGLWMEDASATKGWCHLQVVPFPGWVPKMKRIFLPGIKKP